MTGYLPTIADRLLALKSKAPEGFSRPAIDGIRITVTVYFSRDLRDPAIWLELPAWSFPVSRTT
jgi:hypothetical protein